MSPSSAAGGSDAARQFRHAAGVKRRRRMSRPARGRLDHRYREIMRETLLVLALIQAGVFEPQVFEDERVGRGGGEKIELGLGPFVREEPGAADKDGLFVSNPPQDGGSGGG